MATITKRVLSGSTHGQPIMISNTMGQTPITIHTGVTGTNTIEELYLYCQNNYSANVDLILEWGTSATQAQLVTPVAARAGVQFVIPGLIINGSATGPTVAAFVGGLAGSASPAVSGSALISVTGYVNRIVQ